MTEGKTQKPRAKKSTPEATEAKSDARSPKAATKRSYLKQADVPTLSLEEALRVPIAIFDNYAGRATAPLHIAQAMQVDPKVSQLRLLTGAAIAFGLIDGGAQAITIAPTELAKRIIRPTVEGQSAEAKRESALKPRVFGDFLRQYNGSPLPRREITINILEDMGVPREKAGEVADRLEASAQSVGFLIDIKGKKYVSLSPDGVAGETEREPAFEGDTARGVSEFAPTPPATEVIGASNAVAVSQNPGAALRAAVHDDIRRRRVFVTHGRDRALVEPIKKLLEYGEMEPIIAVERQSVSKPVPQKIMDDMRRCGAAIIHVDADSTIVDGEGNEHVILNPNVMIEIGAAMAFYGRRFILLVREGLKLPSNLQGLFEVRYSSDSLDASATIRLLEAMKDIKNHSLPGEESAT